ELGAVRGVVVEIDDRPDPVAQVGFGFKSLYIAGPILLLIPGIGRFIHGTESHPAVQHDLHTVFLALLGSDHDNAVSSPGPVKRRRGRSFQYVDGSNVVRT